jgi:hypothetical protein
MRVQMPDVHEQRRWKRGRVVDCKTEQEVADLVAQGGVPLLDASETPKAKKGK